MSGRPAAEESAVGTPDGAAAAALGPVKAMLKRTGLQNAQTRTPLNAAEEKAVATLKDLFATIEDGTAYAKLVENYKPGN